MIETAAVLAESATLVATSMTEGGAGIIPGAVKFPPASTLPHAAPKQSLPESVQVTTRFGLPAEFIAAVNGCVAPNSTDAFCGEIETEMSLDSVTCALELFVGSSTLVASTETLAGAGKIAGAVYAPPALIVPTVELPPETPLMLHVTAEFVELVTLAINVC